MRGRGRAEAVDGLEVVADRGHHRAVRRQRPREVHLQPVDVLVLVDQHVVEGRGQQRADHLVGGERAPEQQQVVEVGHAELALAGGVGLEQRRDRLAVLLAPREVLGQHARQRLLRVDRARVDVQQRPLAREARARLRVPVLLAQQVQDVRRVARVEHPEAARQPERRGVAAHEPVRDRVERAAEHARRGGDEPARPLQHLARGAAGERQQQDPLRRHALGHQPGDPRAQRRRLARAGAGEDQQRPTGVRRGGPLLVIERRRARAVLRSLPPPPWPTDATTRLGRHADIRPRTRCLTRYRIAAMEAHVRPLRADAARNRARVLDAARTAFAEAGLDVGVEEIARRAGVGKGTLYRRFPTKEALVRAIFEDILDEVERLVAGSEAESGRRRGVRELPARRRRDAGLQSGLLRRRRAATRRRGAHRRAAPADPRRRRPAAASARRTRARSAPTSCPRTCS